MIAGLNNINCKYVIDAATNCWLWTGAIDHLCRCRRCVNPAHLEVVLPKINTRRGLKTKLTQNQVDEIKRIPKSYGYRAGIKEKYNIGDTQISRILRGESWK